MSSDYYRRSVSQKCGAVYYHNNHMTENNRKHSLRFLLGINIVLACHSCNVYYCVLIPTLGSILLCREYYNALLNVVLNSNSKYYSA
jgi:hypothetical protein